MNTIEVCGKCWNKKVYSRLENGKCHNCDKI